MDVMPCAVLRRRTAGVIAVALLAATATSHAEQVVRHESVSYADLNLNTHEGVITLQRRVRAAVKSVCGPAPDLRELNEMRAEQECRYRALQQATARVEAAIGGARLAAR